MGTAIKHHVPDRVKPSFVIFYIWGSGHSNDQPYHSARMSKITNDGLTWSGTGCFIDIDPYGNSGCQRANIELLMLCVTLRILCTATV